MNRYSIITVLGFVTYLAIMLIGGLAMHKDPGIVQLVAMAAMGCALIVLCGMQLYDKRKYHKSKN